MIWSYITKRLLAVAIAAVGTDAGMSAQQVAVKTNLLYDATTTLNVGIETALSRKWTFEVQGNLNPWSFRDDRKLRHIMVQPELRYWTCERFNGHFFGVHAHWAHYNAAWGDTRYQGDLTGAGLTYGYQWILGKHWNIETAVGVGYARLDHDVYPCTRCGQLERHETRTYIGPTKAAVSIVYIF